MMSFNMALKFCYRHWRVINHFTKCVETSMLNEDWPENILLE